MQRQLLLALLSSHSTPVVEEVRVCGCEHSSVGTAVASPDSELNAAAAAGPTSKKKEEGLYIFQVYPDDFQLY